VLENNKLLTGFMFFDLSILFFILKLLQLDPLMWTSYEALCEMGALYIDPTTVFGVRPAEIERLQERFHEHTSGQVVMPLQEKAVLTPHHFTPSTHGGNPTIGGTGAIRAMDLGTPGTSLSTGPKVSLFQTAQKPKATVESGSAAILPNQLQFDTPNLTPIPMQQDASFIHHHHQQHHLASAGGVTFQQSSMISEADIPLNHVFGDSFNPYTVRRAKHVAGRLYYQPSPETRPYDNVPSIGRNFETLRDPSTRSYLRGKSALHTTVNSKVDFQTTISETPLRRGGRPSDVSTVRRPRALFLSESKAIHENINDLVQNNGRSLEDDEDENFRPVVSRRQGEDMDMVNQNHPDDEQPNMMVTEDNANSYNDVNLGQQSSSLAEDVKLPVMLAGHRKDAIGELAEDTLIEKYSAVQQILDLLCLLGAGYWRLCQVCFM
jgi:hypothetical protein